MHERNGRKEVGYFSLASGPAKRRARGTKAGEKQEVVGRSLSAGLKRPGGPGISILSDDGIARQQSMPKIAIGRSNLRESSSMQAGSSMQARGASQIN